MIAARYRRFAVQEAAGRSPLYEAISLAVAADARALDFLAGLPPARQQPNLLLAAVRLVAGTAEGPDDFLRCLAAHAEAVRQVMLTRTTQTNEPARCAVLLPLLAQLPGPLALIEVGASAGLCLLADRYGYDWGGHQLGGNPRFACAVSGAVPLPQVVWRAGLDLNPLDVRNAEDVAWLECLIWPEQTARLAHFRAAVAIARADPPRVVPGDLTRDLPSLAAQAPADAHLVAFHTAVLSYVPDPAARTEFGRQVRALGATWVANEAPGVLPEIDAGAGPLGLFVLSRDGAPVAWSDPHGARLVWRDA